MRQALWALAGDRPVYPDGSIGPVPFGAAERYAERYRVQDFDRFWRLLVAADRAYLEWMQERRKAKEKKSR